MWGWLADAVGWTAKRELMRLAHLYFAPGSTERLYFADVAIGNVTVPWFLRDRKTTLTNLASTLGHKYGESLPAEFAAGLLAAVLRFIVCGGNYDSLLLEAGIPTTSTNITIRTSADKVSYPSLTEFWLRLSSYEVARFLYFDKNDRASGREICQHLDGCRSFNKYCGFGSYYGQRILKYAVSMDVIRAFGDETPPDWREKNYELVYPAGLRFAFNRWCRVLIVAHRFAPFMSIYHDNPLLSLPHRLVLWVGVILRWGYSLTKATLGHLVVQIVLVVLGGLFFAAIAGFAANVGSTHYWPEVCPKIESFGIPLECQKHGGI